MSLGGAGYEMQDKGLWGNRFAKPYRFQKPIRLWTVLNTNDQHLTTFTPSFKPLFFRFTHISKSVQESNNLFNFCRGKIQFIRS